MSASKVLIISNAFVLLGSNPINSISTGNPIIAAASTIYDSLIPSLLSERPWRFALKQYSLSPLTDSPTLNEWSYIYQLPADCLSVYRSYPNTHGGYAIYGNKLYSNIDSLQIEYIANVDESKFTKSFIMLAVYAMASNIAMPLTQKVSLAQYWDMKKDEQMSIASAIDSLCMPNIAIKTDPFLSARADGGEL